MKKEFKIGDKVIYNGPTYEDIQNGRKCEIVADKNTPYKREPPTLTNLYPTNGKDFLLGQYTTKEETQDKISLPYVSVSKSDLLPLDEE